jgi:signal transduction histidine kinase
VTKPSSFNSAAFRFALLIAGMFALGSVLLLTIVEHSLRAYAAEATAVSLQAETAVLTEDWPDGGKQEVIDTIRHRQRSAYEQPFHYLLLDARGKLLAGDLPLTAARSGWGRVTFVDDAPQPGELSDPETLQTLGTRLADGSLLIVGTDTFDVQRVRHRLAAFTIGSSVALTILALIGGYFIGLMFLRRLDRVNAAVARIMAGSMSERLPPIGMSPELDHLSSNLNAMLDRIAKLMEGLRQVSTDIAHDLRTPLTRLQQRLEAMHNSGTVEAYELGIELALAEIDEIHVIFRALLRIGMIEGGERPQPLIAIDLSELVGRVAEAYRPVAEDAGKIFESVIGAGITVLGDAELLAQLFTNLIDNALVHTPDGTRITVALHLEAGHAIVTVADNGPGVPADERGKILKRFYRLDQSRHTPGAGLGLALVSSIAAVHGSELLIADNHPGLKVTLRFASAISAVGKAASHDLELPEQQSFNS